MFYECDTILWSLDFSFLALNLCQIVLDSHFCLCFPLQRPSLVTVVEWIDYETLALLFGMVRRLYIHSLNSLLWGQCTLQDVFNISKKKILLILPADSVAFCSFPVWHKIEEHILKTLFL